MLFFVGMCWSSETLWHSGMCWSNETLLVLSFTKNVCFYLCYFMVYGINKLFILIKMRLFVILFILIEYNIQNIFLEKSYTKCGGETIPDSFLKNLIWAYFWIDCLKFYTVCFYCMPSWGLLKYIETKLETICFHVI